MNLFRSTSGRAIAFVGDCGRLLRLDAVYALRKINQEIRVSYRSSRHPQFANFDCFRAQMIAALLSVAIIGSFLAFLEPSINAYLLMTFCLPIMLCMGTEVKL